MMMATGTVVYLHTTVDEQVRRTSRDRKRPLLQNDDPRRILSELMAIREPLYREIADIVIDTDSRSPKLVAQDLVDQLKHPH
jgi:shikimate kinase